jgi:spermidine synthase
MLATHPTLMAAQPARAMGEARWVRILSILFFFSGFPALTYQLVWQRALFRIFGVNVESVTIVVTAFMVGLGIGSLVGGWLSRQSRIRLLPLLAGIELLTALFGVGSLEIFEAVETFALGLPLFATALLAFSLVLVPTLLMGATLPVLVGELSRHFKNTGRSMGLLYYANTMGGGAACFVCLAVFFPFLGMAGSIYCAVAMNAAVAGGALYADRAGLGWSAAASSSSFSATGVAASRPTLALSHALALAGLAGFVSLSFEILFFRMQSYATGGSASAFACTLGAFLVGIASGSSRAGVLASELPDAAAAKELLKEMAVGCFAGFLYLPVMGIIAGFPGSVFPISLLFVGIVARAWGLVMPYLAHLGIAADRNSGTSVSYLYMANIVGSAAGSILTGFVLVQYVSVVGVAQLLTVLGLVGTALLWRALGSARPVDRRTGAMATIAAGLAVVLLPILTPRLLEKLQFGPAPQASVPFDRVIENRSGIVSVDAQGTVWGNGMYDGRFNTSLVQDTNGVVRPYALSLLHPAPRHVLMVGLASGSWARIVAANPHVESLTIVEINQAYVALISQRAEVAPLLKDPKVKIVIDDGRRWLKLNPERKFDAVISNTTWYYRANVTNLLSREFLALVRDHLAPGGIFYYNTTSSPRAQRTACLEMPYAMRFSNHMVVSQSPIAVDFDRWHRVLTGYQIGGVSVFDPANAAHASVLNSLMQMRSELPSVLAAGGAMLEGCAGILARTQGQVTFTDDNMGSEWRRSLGLD